MTAEDIYDPVSEDYPEIGYYSIQNITALLGYAAGRQD